MFNVNRLREYRVTIEQNLPMDRGVTKSLLSEEDLKTLVLTPYNNGTPFAIDGIIVRPEDIGVVNIFESSGTDIRLNRFPSLGFSLFNRDDRDVTESYILGPPGGQPATGDSVSKEPLPSSLSFDQLVTNGLIREASRKRFLDGQYSDAVEAAFKCVNNAVKHISGAALDGADLMRTVFSANSPVLRFNAFQSQSDKNEQQGYMDIYAGSMTGIRNPRAHQHDLVDEPEVALELLVLANHLMRKLDAATKPESPATTP